MRSTDFPFAVMPQGYAVRRMNGGGGMSARRKSQERAFEDPEKLASGVSSIPRRVMDYFRTNTPSGIISDIGSVASSTYEAAKDDPGQFAADAILSPLAAIRDFADLRERARELRAQGLNDEAEKIEAMTGAVAMSAIPIVGRFPAATAKSAMKKSVKADAPTLAVKPDVVEPLAVKPQTLPAPEAPLAVKPQALPAPQLEASLAVKPQGSLRKTIDLDYYGSPVQVMQNPTPARLQGFLNKTKYKAARRIVDPASGDVYVWDADAPALHALVAERLGLKYDSNMGDMIGLD
jgi:hypothetical protein